MLTRLTEVYGESSEATPAWKNTKTIGLRIVSLYGANSCLGLRHVIHRSANRLIGLREVSLLDSSAA